MCIRDRNDSASNVSSGNILNPGHNTSSSYGGARPTANKNSSNNILSWDEPPPTVNAANARNRNNSSNPFSNTQSSGVSPIKPINNKGDGGAANRNFANNNNGNSPTNRSGAGTSYYNNFNDNKGNEDTYGRRGVHDRQPGQGAGGVRPPSAGPAFNAGPSTKSGPMTQSAKEEIAANTAKTVKNIETNLMSLQMEKSKLTMELQKLDESKMKTGNQIRRKKEIETDLGILDTNISNLKQKLREMNALHPY
eukprot:TRINITY_DN12493_c0_g1_i1.p1 TRINITY_DN12493_c0_g1~~TRINITY_DN12493_c0_g1_i1.p1  ORF type:complete len:261 (-),score=61.00 TRINITY_DN12493_c0_g1_i1:51-803(-)